MSGDFTPLPVWAIRPDWASGMLERLEWLTSILASITGAEQRLRLRLTPRRTFEMGLQIYGNERTLYDMGLKAQGSSDWYVPLWYDVDTCGTLENNEGIQQTVVPVDCTQHEYTPGCLMIFYQDNFTYEVCQVLDVDGTAGLVLSPCPSGNWQAGTQIIPIMRASLTEDPSATRQADRALKVTIGFTSKTANPFTQQPPITDLYLGGYFVLTTPPDESVDMKYQFERLKNDIDPTVGLRATVDTAGFGFGTQQFSWWSTNPSELIALRGFLYLLNGRQTPLWVPTFYADMQLVQPVGSTDGTITVARCGYTDYDGPTLPGRQDLAFFLKSGQRVYRRVVSSVISGATEVLTLSSPLGVPVPLSGYQRISFLSLCRQNSDTVEIQHQVAGGIATITTQFREAPDLRSLLFQGYDPVKSQNGVISDFGYVIQQTDVLVKALGLSVTGQTSGQYYVEQTVTAQGVIYGDLFGLALASALIGNMNGQSGFINAVGMGFDNDALYIQNNGTEINGGVAVSPPGNVFCLAVDFERNLIWLGSGSNPIFNFDVDADPAAGTGGIDISWRGSNPLFIAAGIGQSGTQIEACSLNLGQKAFVNAAPTGFYPGWPVGGVPGV